MAAKRRSNKRRTRKPTAKRRNLSIPFLSGRRTTRRRGRRRANPVSRRRGRRRNPVSAGVIAEGFKLGASGLLIGFAQPTIRNLIGRFLPTGPIASVGITLATGYGLGALAGFTRFTASWKRPLELAGWTIAGAQLISTYVLPALSGFTAGFQLQGAQGNGNGMSGARRLRGIGVTTGIPPNILPPPPVAAAPATMRGFATLPGSRY